MEDKAVDLYVLERAFSSTHPDSEPLFTSVLEAYASHMGKGWPLIERRLKDGQFLSLEKLTLLTLSYSASERSKT